MPTPSPSKRTCRVMPLLLCAAAGVAGAQTTDGYHTIQVFPVVVDSGSFTQKFTFRNPDASLPVTVAATYYTGGSGAVSTATACPGFTMPADGQRSFSSLRALCPGIAAGNTFGYLYTAEDSSGSQPYAAYSRISNPQGNGFSVEAFPAHTFTSADTAVTGLRRLAATPGSPAFQSNCFIGSLNDVTPPGTPVSNDIVYALFEENGTPIGNPALVTVKPGTLTRLLDVFAAVGAPAGNYDNARIQFSQFGPDYPGVMTFCTVQDNTSFGADFRIGKQEYGYGSLYSGLAAQDDHVARNSDIRQDVFFSGLVSPREFDIPPGAYSNTHVMYFRHPDRVQCLLYDPQTGTPLDASAGLEMRLLDGEANVIAGGDNMTGFGEIYLGDKTDRNFGANGRYLIEVESSGSGPNLGNTRKYGLRCQSGSGHSAADMVRYHEATTRF